MVVNTYTIEGWEIERHEVLLRRARVLGGYLDGPDGKRIRIVRQEFPYDIGLWNNVVQGMGTSNVGFPLLYRIQILMIRRFLPGFGRLLLRRQSIVACLGKPMASKVSSFA